MITHRPTGTVTFLFTDIEGSTQLWERQRPWMEVAHPRHEAILRRAIEAEGGWAYKQVGDAFQAAFQTADAALAAAVAAQLALLQEWPGDSERGIGRQGSEGKATRDTQPALRVRMALHTGTTAERPDDYVGPLLNRVARLLAAGHGGQILLTATTYELIRDLLPAGLGLRDLGERQLRDLLRPDHVYQVLALGLPDEFPPLRTLDPRPNNLPRRTTLFVGREAETARVVDLLQRPGVALVTLTGPGGIGKTRLALQTAAELLDDFAGGCWFVELSALTNPGLVVSTVAQVLGVPEVLGATRLATLQRALQDQEKLLVLDNFEQVAGAAPDVGHLLSACPRLKVLVTSRMPLQIRGEREITMPPLTVPDPRRLPPHDQLSQYEAVRLFIDRAVAVKADFAVTNENAPAVAEICARLDGLPLAIELAAARIRVLPPQAMLPRLESRLRLLVGGSRDVTARQQTLRGTIDWSYGLLDPTEQQLFRRLAVFQGGRTLEAIEAACGQGSGIGDQGSEAINTPIPDVLDGIESLVAKSLVQQREGPGGEPRFWMLETIHEYAHERLAASGEEEALRDRHLAYFLRLAQEASGHLRGPEQVAWMERLEADHDNLRTALDWAHTRPAVGAGLALAIALTGFWFYRGYPSEGREQFARLLTLPGARPETRAQALVASSSIAWLQGDNGVSRELADEARALAETTGDRVSLALALARLALVEADEGDYLAGRRYLEQSLLLRRALEDSLGVVRSVHNLGVIAIDHGDLFAGRQLLEEALGMWQQQHDQWGTAAALHHLAVGAHSEGDESRARALHRESLLLLQELRDQRVIAEALEAVAALATEDGRPANAIRLLAAAAAIREANGLAIPSKYRTRTDQVLARARAEIGRASFDAAWAAGCALGLDGAIAAALAECEPSA